MKRRLRRSLGARVLGVALLALLPIAALLTLLWIEARQRDRADGLRSLRQTTEALAVVTDTILDGGITFARGLATDPAIRSLDAAVFVPRLRELQAQTGRIRRMLVVDASGTVLGWSTADPLPTPPPSVAGRRFFQTAVTTRQPVIIRAADTPTAAPIEVGAAVPLVDAGGAVRGLVAVEFNVDELGQRLSDVQLFPDQIVSVFDPNGRIVLLLGAPGVSVADLTPEQRARADLPEVRTALAGQPVVTDQFVGPLFGSNRLAAFIPTPRHGWVVSSTWPTAAAFADARSAQQRELVAFLGIALAAILGALVASRALIRPLRRVAEHARRLGDGDVEPIPAAATGGIGEIADLAETLNAMGERLRRTLGDLREREQVLRALLDQFPASVAVIDRDLRYVLAAGRRVVETGVPAEALVGRSLAELYSDTLIRRLREHAEVAFAGHETAYEVTDGGVILAVHLFPLRAQDNAIPNILTISFDVTAEREARERASRDEKLHALGQMAGGIAHNLNQTLTLVTGYGELARAVLDQSPENTQELRRMIRIVERAAYDGGETVKRLLTFARGQANERQQRFDVAELLHEVALLTTPRWKERVGVEGRSVDLRVDAPPGLQMIGALGGLREAITNLVFNALDALPHGGSIVLAARRSGPQTVIEVADSGEGMPPEVQQRIFEPFFTTKGTNGTGLGLAMVFGIVRHHDGQIDVVSAPGEGTVIRLTLPTGDLGPPGPAAEARAGAASPLQILVVDDEARLAALAAGMLQRDGHRVVEAYSGDMALERLRGEPFDLLITDLSMGEGMNGWELAEAVCAARPGLPVVLLTGWGAALDEAEARRRGVWAVLSKPFRIAELREVIVRVMADAARPTG